MRKLRANRHAEATYAAGRFSGYLPESERETRTSQVQQNGNLVAMRTAFERLSLENPANSEEWLAHAYRDALGLAKAIRCPAVDVDGFNLALIDDPRPAKSWSGKRFDVRAGIFLSALINSSDEPEFILHTGHRGKGVSSLAYRCSKKLTVIGDPGTHCGRELDGGTLVIEGDCDSSIGNNMRSGTIIVKGHGGSHFGADMSGGEMVVEEHAGRRIGSNMKGGMITVEGDAEDDIGSSMWKGRIMIKGSAGSDIGYEMRDGCHIEILKNAGDRVGYYMLGGFVKVGGNTGRSAGLYMDGGTVEIYGDTGRDLGTCMKNGTITVHGNAGKRAGHGMNGGIIRIFGGSGKETGKEMRGGELHIEGDIESLSEKIHGGKIFHKGELIFSKDGESG